LIVGLLGTDLFLLSFETLRREMPNLPGFVFLVAVVGALLLSVVQLRVNKRALGSAYPFWRPLQYLRIQLGLLFHGAPQAVHILGWRRWVGWAIEGALALGAVALIAIVVLSRG
jgi:hypothetical protein